MLESLLSWTLPWGCVRAFVEDSDSEVMVYNMDGGGRVVVEFLYKMLSVGGQIGSTHLEASLRPSDRDRVEHGEGESSVMMERCRCNRSVASAWSGLRLHVERQVHPPQVAEPDVDGESWRVHKAPNY